MRHILSILFLLLAIGVKAQDNTFLLQADAFEAALQNNKGLIMDVRTPDEFASGAIAGAVNYNFRSPDFKEKVLALDKNQVVYVYCLAGGRSAEAAKILRSNGFEKVVELKGGTLAWSKAGKPLGATVAIKKDQYSMEDYTKLY